MRYYMLLDEKYLFSKTETLLKLYRNLELKFPGKVSAVRKLLYTFSWIPSSFRQRKPDV